MVFSLFRRSAADTPSAPLPRVPEDLHVYAIGDVHGRADLLERLLYRIDADRAARRAAATRIILLGDLIDRGPESCEAVQLCMTRDWRGAEPSFIAGNHEEMMLAALGGDLEAMRFWMRNGGVETMLSYGVSPVFLERATTDQIAHDLVERVPGKHLRFLRAMADHVEIGDYWFVHAGIRPGLPLDRQKPSDLRWIRSLFLNHPDSHGAIVVHGHTITDEIDERTNRIGIDTGAYASGRLTALGLNGGERWYLST